MVACFTVAAGTTEKHRKLWGIQDLHVQKWMESYIRCNSHSEVFRFLDLVVFAKGPPLLFSAEQESSMAHVSKEKPRSRA